MQNHSSRFGDRNRLPSPPVKYFPDPLSEGLREEVVESRVKTHMQQGQQPGGFLSQEEVSPGGAVLLQDLGLGESVRSADGVVRYEANHVRHGHHGDVDGGLAGAVPVAGILPASQQPLQDEPAGDQHGDGGV